MRNLEFVPNFGHEYFDIVKLLPLNYIGVKNTLIKRHTENKF